MGNVDSAPSSQTPHAHPHLAHGDIYLANGNGHSQNSVYSGGSVHVHQVVDTRGAPIGSDYVDVGAALEAITKEDMERRFLEIVVSRTISAHLLASVRMSAVLKIACCVHRSCSRITIYEFSHNIVCTVD